MSIAGQFNPAWYLKNNPDVATAIQNGTFASALEHYMQYGKQEGRAPSALFNPEEYLAANPDVAEAVKAGSTTAADHFFNHGISEGRVPGAWFDADFYLAQNTDVAAASKDGGINAVQHFFLYGASEPRQITVSLDLSKYLEANKDIKEAVDAGAFTAIDHFLTYGIYEPRNLGNGVDLSWFKDDPTFLEALNAGDTAAAFARVEKVAPFFKDFEKPEGWELPEGAKPPADYTPPKDVEIITPEVPPVTPPAFEAMLKDGEIKFENGAGDITVSLTSDGAAVFTRGAQSSTIEDIAGKSITVSADQTIRVSAQQLQVLSLGGEGVVSVTGLKDGTSTLANGDPDRIKNVKLTVENSHVVLPNNAESNVLTYVEGQDTALKTLSIDVRSGTSNSIDLGNNPGDTAIGYFLKNVNVAGTGNLDLKTLYFGKEGTQFDSTGLTGNVQLDALVYHGAPEAHEWSIKFGAGNDTLSLAADSGTGNYPATGSTIDGGDGYDTLHLNSHTYGNWQNPPTRTEATVTGFERLEVDVQDGASYVSELFGNTFTDLKLNVSETATVTIESGFENVYVAGKAEGSITIDASALKGGKAEVDLTSLNFNGNVVVVKVAEINAAGNKGDLTDADGRKSDQAIKVGTIDQLNGAELIVENATIASTKSYALPEPVHNDVIDLTSWGLSKAQILSSVTSLVISEGEALNASQKYVSFSIGLDLDNDASTPDFTLTLENIVSEKVYNNMLKAVDTVNSDGTLESTVGLYQWLQTDGNAIDDKGELFTEYGFTIGAGLSAKDDPLTLNVSEGGTAKDAIVGLVGILVDEGTFDVAAIA